MCTFFPWIKVGDEGPLPFASVHLETCGDSSCTMQLTWVHPEEVVSTWFYLKPGPISLQQPGQIALICAAWQQPWKDSWFVWTMSLTFKCYCVSNQQSIHSPDRSVIQSQLHSFGVGNALIFHQGATYFLVGVSVMTLCHNAKQPVTSVVLHKRLLLNINTIMITSDFWLLLKK